MKLSSFDYSLPKTYIAQRPPFFRGTSKLLVLDKKTGQVKHKRYYNFTKYPQKGDVVVLNNTKVINARVYAQTAFGGKLELMFLEAISATDDHKWKVLIGNSKRLRSKKDIYLGTNKDLKLTIEKDLGEGEFIVSLPTEAYKIFTKYGHVPLPKYIKRPDTKQDQKRYQTIFAQNLGAVAAPTASLNMTKRMIRRLKAKGVELVYVNLKVSWDTFKPVRETDISKHKMHSEYIEITDDTASKINSANEVWAIGTTVVRTLESVSDINGLVKPYSGQTNIYIYPGYKFRVIDHMLTNFHAPKTTVLMMACAFAGKNKLFEAYEIAKQKGYKFLSYGDSMLIL